MTRLQRGLLKEFTGVASVTWVTVPTVRGAKVAQEVFDERWKGRHSYPLDDTCIEKLIQLKETYLSDSNFERDVEIQDLDKAETYLINNRNPTVFYFGPDKSFIENLILKPPQNLKQIPQINLIEVGTDNTQLLLYMLLCDKYNIPHLLFVDSFEAMRFEDEQEGHSMAKFSRRHFLDLANETFGEISQPHEAIYLGVMTQLGLEVTIAK